MACVAHSVCVQEDHHDCVTIGSLPLQKTEYRVSRPLLCLRKIHQGLQPWRCWVVMAMGALGNRMTDGVPRLWRLRMGTGWSTRVQDKHQDSVHQSTHSVPAGPSSSQGRATAERPVGAACHRSQSTVDTGPAGAHSSGNQSTTDFSADWYPAGPHSLHKGGATADHQCPAGAASHGNWSTSRGLFLQEAVYCSPLQ